MKQVASLAVSFCALIFGANEAAFAQVRFQTGTADLGRQPSAEVAQIIQQASGRRRHMVVQFSEPVTAAQRRALEAAGVVLQDYLGENAYFAAVSASHLDAARLGRVGSLTGAAAIERHWKLHPILADGQVPDWAAVSPIDKQGDFKGKDAPPTARSAAPVNPVVGVYVKLFDDVPLATQAVRVCRAHGANIRSKLRTVHALVIELPLLNIAALADAEEVQWIEPALPRLGENNADNRLRTGADLVQAAPYNLDGSGVSVLVYDGGTGRSSHVDFGGRHTNGDSAPLSDHSTHVAGTIGGSGAASGGTNRGMAPAVTIWGYGFEYDGSGIFLYTNPGDIEDDYGEAVANGADIANNSIGTNTETNGFSCSIQGDYGLTSSVIDGIVRGSLGAPFRVVWANGNERQGSRCDVEGFGDYYSTAPPAGAKNHIAVGALNSNDDSMTYFSSWGPVDDGRMKPDLSAPGCQSNGDTGVTSCSSSSDTSYTVKCGTSMASPTVCGLAALLLEDFRAHYPAQPDFRNSTLKILLCHTAVDLGNPGPDYQFGYGSVRIQPCVDFMRSGNFLESQVSQGESYNVLVIVGPTDLEMKVTLAWDDFPGTPNSNPALVNDLDLLVTDPSSNRRFPWTLNPASPSSAAVQTAEDHVNNIEQVLVSAPPPGVYRIEVRGTTVPQGPQPFSLCASPLLVNCSSQGVISLDRNKYQCSSTATLQVIDCDLNTNDNVVETVNVTIASTSEPGGETVLLTETDGATATFRGTINLDTVDAAGTLLVTPADAVTATYIDADDGQGGLNVTVTDTATVDCTAPVISSVQVIDLGPRSATITFDTDEPTSTSLSYGLACGALTGVATEGGLPGTSHSITLTNLDDNTPYFFTVTATDEAGNETTDDNGAACYTFTTTEIPDFFTEIFENSDNDLAYRSILFAPAGTIDQYGACAVSIAALPTDPAGGATLSLSDDGSAFVSLSGGQTVQLYGVSYGSFYVNANGNLTFLASDGDYTESLSEHFAVPRVAALWDDLNPSTGGTVSWKQLSDRVAVTWQNVPEYSTSNQNTFQIELYFDGRIQLSYLSIAVLDGVAGLSEGQGLSPDFYETDLTASSACGPLPPSASSATLMLASDIAVVVTLQASDPNLDPLTYIVTSLPAHGTLRDEGAGPILSVPYTLVLGGNQVRYTPELGYGGPDSFTFKANDGSFDSNLATITLNVGAPQSILSFPMDGDPGWSVENQWAFGAPLGAGGDPSSGFTGSNVYGYNLAGAYPNNMPSTYYLTTTALDCTGATSVELRFRRWLGVESASYDHANVQVSNNGSTWTTVWSHTGPTMTESSWSLQAYDISAVADNQATVYVRWGMGTTDTSITYSGWNIDDVEIFGVTASLCVGGVRGDVNDDTQIDAKDVQLFSTTVLSPGAATQQQRCTADVNADGTPDVNDIDEFVELLLGQ